MDNVSISLKVNGALVSVHPVFGDDVKLKISRETDQVFYRTKIDGTIKLSGDDFTFVADSSNEVEFELEVKRGAVIIGTAKFIKADCELDYDDKVCSVKLSFSDKYEKVVSGLDNKYNLPKLAPRCVPITMNKRPVLQFYFFGDTKITNWIGNMAWEVDAGADAPNKTLTQMENTYKFTRLLSYGEGSLSMNSSYFNNDADLNAAAGDYKVEFDGSTIEKLVQVGGPYEFRRIYSSELMRYSYQLYKNGSVLRATETVGGYDVSYPTEVSITESGTVLSFTVIVLHQENSHYVPYRTIGTGEGAERIIFCRMLSDYGGDYAGESKVELKTLSDDVAVDNYNYLYGWTVAHLDLGDNMLISAEVQDNPTEYGVDGNGKYFVQPTPSSSEDAIYPIGWNMWIPLSFWFEGTPAIMTALDTSVFYTSYFLRDAYPLSSAIQVLLSQIDDSLTYDPTYDSKFFNEKGWQGDWAYIPSPAMRNNILYITPITNVKKTRYEQPARKGDITLKQIFDMLRQVYGCYWYIEEGHLKIEHIAYFKNGNNYVVGSPSVLLDVVGMKDMPNGLSWAFKQNAVAHDRTRCPNRYEFQWANSCTEQFNGYPIDIKDKVASADKKEKTQVANFIADVDYCIISPESVSDDIYALIEAGRENLPIQSRNFVPIARVSNGDNAPIYAISNGYCSFLFAERAYLNYDYGGYQAIADGKAIEVKGTRRFIKQECNFPMPIAKVGQIGLIKTGLGLGEIDEMDINADTLYAKTKLFLENEDDFVSQITIGRTTSSLVRIYQVKNNSGLYLNVRVVLKNKSTGDVALDTTQMIAPGGVYEPLYSVTIYDCYVLAAKRVTGMDIEFGRFVEKYGSPITITYSNYAEDTATINMNGHQISAGKTWGYIPVTFKRQTFISILASTQSLYGYAYIAESPILQASAVEGNALAYATGNNGVFYTVNAGQMLYLGFVREGIDNGDFAEFGMTAQQ